MENILSQFLRKSKTLHFIADQDPLYIAWERMSEDAKKEYDRLMRFFPRKMKQIISNYINAEVSRITYLKCLALHTMEFSPEILKQHSPETDNK